jgi:SHS2 domain-containing protein
MGSHEILEHTADVGIRARGATLEECFEQATWGLAGIADIARPGAGESVAIELDADDPGALLVDWLSEVLYLHDVRDAVITSVSVDRAGRGRVAGSISLAPRGDVEPDGTQVKAITYHRLRVEHSVDGYVAEVYLDV